MADLPTTTSQTPSIGVPSSGRQDAPARFTTGPATLASTRRAAVTRAEATPDRAVDALRTAAHRVEAVTLPDRAVDALRTTGHRVEAAAPPNRDRAVDALRALTRRVEAATQPDRDRAVDALRGLAILGVVLGHWLVSAVFVRGDGHLLVDSPLRHTPALTPLSWILQPLAVFFLVGGHVGALSHASAESRGIRYRTWLAERMNRLFRPIAALVGLWFVILAGLVMFRVPFDTERTVLTLVLSPLWFLLVYGLLTAATPAVRRLVRRGPGLAVAAVAVVAAVDVARFGLGWDPGRLGLVNVVAGWLVPYGIGAAWAAGAFTRRRTAVALLAFGTLATIALVMWCGYPATMVGVPGARISNLNPPTLAAVTFGLAQCGLALLLRDPLARLMRRPAVWAPVAMLNLSAITVFLWHQSAMLFTTAVALPVGRLPGLHTAPDHPGWILARLAWLPVFAVVLVAGVVLKSYRVDGPDE